MKFCVVLLLIVTLFAFIVAPFSVETGSADTTGPRFLKLNVCHTANAFLTGSADIPYLLHNDIILHAPPGTCTLEVSPQHYIDLLIFFDEEKPPQV